MPTLDDLKILRSLSLDLKIQKTKIRIKEFVSRFGVDNVYVSFSGGLDSTVLLHIARTIYPKMKACFCNTGLEYPEIQKFIKNFENVDIITPKLSFCDVIKKYGYPFISKDVAKTIYYFKKGSNFALDRINGINSKTGKRVQYRIDRYGKWVDLLKLDYNISHYCCIKTKEEPLNNYSKFYDLYPIVATLTEESKLREEAWLKTGCNAFNSKKILSKPISFWTKQDILTYAKLNSLSYCKIYGDIVYCDNYFNYDTILYENDNIKLKTTLNNRQGCIFCGFGAHNDKYSRFKQLKITHPKQYYYCMEGGEYNQYGVWVPNKNGLGMYHCIDELNTLYGKKFIEY